MNSNTEGNGVHTAVSRGSVELICGCMFSGKTTALLQRLEQDEARCILVIKHTKDARYSRTRIMTHDGHGCDAVSAAEAEDIIQQTSESTEVVAIDEGHFYDEKLPEVVDRLANAGKRVLITTLDMDMWGRPFPIIQEIERLATRVSRQLARCAVCGQPGTHTQRRTPIVNRNLVGGSDDFEPRCGTCWRPPPESPIDSNEMA